MFSDISVESGVFPGCDFEADTCQWKDISVGQFVWQRDQNGTITANTGPSVDHTTGTELGKNMMIYIIVYNKKLNITIRVHNESIMCSP